MKSAVRMGTLAALLLLTTGCSATYPYLPPGRSAAPPSGSAAPAPPAESPGGQTPLPGPHYAAPPVEPQPDLAQKLRDLELRVQQLESRLGQLEAGKPVPPARKEARAAAPQGYPPPAGTTAAVDGDKTYREGMRLYQAKKFSEARGKFHQYLQGRPPGPKAPEARYHLADSFYQEGKYKEAAVEFNKLASQFPKNILAPAALLRQAQAYQHLQQTANYRSTLTRLEQAYPQSPEAREANKRLKER